MLPNASGAWVGWVLGFPMGSTGEPDRKRRHFSSISPTAAAAAADAAATAKKQPFLPISEDKKVRNANFGCFKFIKNYIINSIICVNFLIIFWYVGSWILSFCYLAYLKYIFT